MDLQWLQVFTSPVEENEIYKAKSPIDFNLWFINQVRVFLNCTRVMKCGQRANQTNDPRYKNELSLTIASIESNIDINEQERYLKILKLRHELNLSYELKHGFDYEIKKKKQTKDKVKKVDKTKKSKYVIGCSTEPTIDLSRLNFILN